MPTTALLLLRVQQAETCLVSVRILAVRRSRGSETGDMSAMTRRKLARK